MEIPVSVLNTRILPYGLFSGKGNAPCVGVGEMGSGGGDGVTVEGGRVSASVEVGGSCAMEGVETAQAVPETIKIMNMNNNFCMGEGYKKVERVANSFYHKSDWIEEIQSELRIATRIRRISGMQNLIPIYVSAITSKS